MAKNIIGKFKGYNVYKISLKDYLGLTDKARNDKDYIYAIEEDRYCFYEGICIGRANETWKNIQLTNSNRAINYKVMYSSKTVTEATDTVKAQEVISERKTVENMAKVVDKALQNDAMKVDDLLNEDFGNNLLDNLYKQGQVLCDKVQIYNTK